MTIKNTIPPNANKPETAKRWLQRHLRKQPSYQVLIDREPNGLRRRISIQRPRTAPSSRTGANSIDVPVTAAATEYRTQPQNQPPSSLLTPGIARDVDAWLGTTNANVTPPLMGGIPYWRAATSDHVRAAADTQHAIPLKQAQNSGRPVTPNDQQAKSLRRGYKKFQAQMPLIGRNKSQRSAAQKQVNRRSNSVPVLGFPYDDMSEGEQCAMMTRTRFLPIEPTPVPEASAPEAELKPLPDLPSVPLPIIDVRTEDARAMEGGGSIGRRMGVFFSRSSRSGDSTRPSTATTHLMREDSLGDLSDAPTYFSGLPPPSYRSRGTSILSTSSFGCVDGMNPEYRQLSQKRAAVQRSVKGRLKKFAQNFAT